ncbi:Protein maternal effect lethal 26 like protein [Argiope bruennichi]|uniref:Protein maternal effect lethal 26 like protein n=1 Tax=Argiope bruennichi TaxID=94029 RepID=A0A8T0FF00_ARGBR|nr:Protein maternal effect lethal 26 like protein [Argiope bruennichi]
MAAKDESEKGRNGCTFQWNIENISHCWSLKKGEKIKSHSFNADVLKETKWSLLFYPMGAENENYMGIGLRRERDCTGPSFIECTIWIAHQELIKSQHLLATTIFKLNRLPFIWKINEFSSYVFGGEKKIEDQFSDLETIFKETAEKMGLDLSLLDDNIIYYSLKFSIIDAEGRKGNSVLLDCLKDDPNTEELACLEHLEETVKENKSRYFPNDVLSLEFVLTFVHLDYRKSGAELEKEAVVKRVSCDTELRTATQTFPAHQVILSARSPVFRSLFSSDMREKNSGHVDITDFENDTIHRMLLYMYTDSLEDLQFESAFELYKAADKYQILSLKSRCSSFLKESLCPSNACEMLILADLHSDDDLKGVVQEYILRQNKQFFCSQEWKDFMKVHIKLASDVMYQKMCQD